MMSKRSEIKSSCVVISLLISNIFSSEIPFSKALNLANCSALSLTSTNTMDASGLTDFNDTGVDIPCTPEPVQISRTLKVSVRLYSFLNEEKICL